MSNRSPLCYLDGDYPHSFLLTPVSVSEVSTIISGLNSSKSVGPNSIPIALLKILNNELSEILSKLVNDSFEYGIFPDKLKIARVTPVFKKGSRLNRDNYRPVSVLSIFSKIYKKRMYKRLYNYLEKYDILYSLQFGFREKMSTSQALMSISEMIRKSIDNKEYGCSVFTDPTKAFDTVHHSNLLSKLNHYGIRGIAGDWFRSFITNRKQFVTVNGSNSDLLPITCGVPQGSVLGPLLFLLYINDLPNTSSQLKFHLFADDTSIYYLSRNLSDIESLINTELKSVANWMKANRLSISTSKTNFILFHSPKNKPRKTLNVKIDGNAINEVQSVKYLGVEFDSNLTWKPHISQLSLKLSKTVGVLSKIRYFVDSDVLVMLYYALIFSFLNYGIETWGLTYPSYLKPISIIQKKCIRIMTFSEPQSHSEALL